MKNDHSNKNNNYEKEEQILENKKKIHHIKMIPLQSNCLFIQSDIRLKIYSNEYQQSIHSKRFLLPEFAKNSSISNPNGHFKCLLNNNNISTKDEINHTNKNYISSINYNSM